jgi:hypothetical protein
LIETTDFPPIGTVLSDDAGDTIGLPVDAARPEDAGDTMNQISPITWLGV